MSVFDKNKPRYVKNQSEKNKNNIHRLKSFDFKKVQQSFFKKNNSVVIDSMYGEIFRSSDYESDLPFFSGIYIFTNLTERYIPFIKIIPKIKTDLQPDRIYENFYYHWRYVEETDVSVECYEFHYLFYPDARNDEGRIPMYVSLELHFNTPYNFFNTQGRL